jgi:2-(1,2-epoxy-1,2-dihydrophenyl)acetyl-CoA isomerase
VPDAAASTLIAEQVTGVLTLTINRPERGNALDGPTVDLFIDVLQDLAADPGEVRAVLLRSEGRHFCTGADIGGAGSGKRGAIGHMVRALGRGPHRMVELLWDCRLPVVAELTGRSSGLGLHVALTADVTVAAESATFAEPFADRGFSVDSGGSWLLPRMVGLTRAKRMLYTSEVVDAPTALEWGLVSEVVPDAMVVTRAQGVAATLARQATFALGVTKGLLHRHLQDDLGAALRSESEAVELTIRSDDFKEGIRAFGEKRPPGFTGR